MPLSIEERIVKARTATPTWDPVTGGRRAWVCFDDHKAVELGDDPEKLVFHALANKILSGDYYPNDAVEFFGEFRTEERPLRQGDRIVQLAPLAQVVSLWSVAEVFVAETSETECRLGYVTTDQHFGRGIWCATLVWSQGRTWLTVVSTASPGSWLFWIGLPVARYLQLRARSRSVQEFTKIAQAVRESRL